MTRLPSTLASIASSRLVATGRSRAVMASPVGAPTDRSPVVDMMEQAERKRSGWWMTSAWVIMPPMETPTTWARSMPSSVEQRRGVVGHVLHAVGRRRRVAREQRR